MNIKVGLHFLTLDDVKPAKRAKRLGWNGVGWYYMVLGKMELRGPFIHLVDANYSYRIYLARHGKTKLV